MTDVPSSSPKPKLTGIEALRGIAALSVLLYHAARHVNAASGAPLLMGAFQAGHAGVDLFFVLSGFLILHVHGRDIGRPGRIGHYARQRFTRVMPLYWIALGLTILKAMGGGHDFPGMDAALRSVLLLPGWQEPLLGPAWSLQHELVFYIVFAVLILHRGAGLALLGLWGVAVLAGLSGGLDANVPFQIIGHYNLEFLFGLVVALVLPRLRGGRMLSILGVLLLVAAGLMEGQGWFDGYGVAGRFAYGLPSAMLIAGLAALSKEREFAIPRWLGALGGASYSIYLFQFLFMGLAVKFWQMVGMEKRPDLGWLLFLLMVCAGIVGGLLTSRLVEKPLLRWMRRGVGKRPEPVLGSA
ncbi:MAG TPA: acyltransferase [Sphingobium sp.]|uniref:acyltransferase family protein n=1 Tax=Sphingobium sp. TaxID=1912891 RepID=UPI002ED3BB48